MPKFQVIVLGKDNEGETYNIEADDFPQGNAEGIYQFVLEGKPTAWFQKSQVVAIIDKGSQK
jgi:hypothetical protein